MMYKLCLCTLLILCLLCGCTQQPTSGSSSFVIYLSSSQSSSNESSTSSSSSSLASSSEVSSALEPLTTIIGVVKDASMHVIVLDVQGQEVTLFMDDDTKSEGDWALDSIVDVVYKNVGSDKFLVIISEYDSSTRRMPMTMVGSIVDATMNGVTIKTADGNTQHFNKDDNTVVTANMALGNIVKITYSDVSVINPVALRIDNENIAVRS